MGFDECNVHVQRATEHEIPQLEAFYARAFGQDRSSDKFPERWRWLNSQNPFIPDDGIPIWLAKMDEKIIGHTGAMYVPLKIGDRSVLGAWSVDTIVLPEHRGKGVGKLLQRANQDSHQIFMSLSMSPANRSIKKKLGSMAGPSVRLYLRAETFRSSCIYEDAMTCARERGTASRALVWLVGHLGGIRAATVALEACVLRKQSRNVTPFTRCSDVSLFPGWLAEEANALWNTVRDDYDFTVEKTSAYLNWKFHDQPGLDCQQAYAYHNGQPTGLVVFRLVELGEAKVGVIHELICARDDHQSTNSLIDFALETFRARQANAAYIASSLPEHQSCIIERGFLPVSEHNMMIHGHSGVEINEAYAGALLGKGDHDWDRFPPSGHPSLGEIRSVLRNPIK